MVFSLKSGFSAWLEYLSARRKSRVPFLYELRGKRVLDMGCGEGNNLVLDPKNWVGLDINENTVKLARAKGYNVKQGSVTDCPFDDSTFDAIIAYQLIEHLPPDQAHSMLKEMSRLLKKGGVAYITSPMPSKVWGSFTHIRPYPPGAINKILTYEANETQNRVGGLKIDLVLYYGPRITLPVIGVFTNFLANVTPFLKKGYLLRVVKT